MQITNTFSLLVATTLHLASGQVHELSNSQQISQIDGRQLRASPDPWDIDFLNLSPNFHMDSDDEVVLTYLVGENRPHETELFAKDCESPITGINITLVDSRTPDDATHDLLTLAYDFDKSAIVNSSIWNPNAEKIELCQVVQLTIPAAGPAPKLVIAEDIRVLEIEFDLSVNYTMDNSGLPLGNTTIESEVGSSNFTSSVKSCKCGGVDDFGCDSQPLVPNSVLYLCIKSASSGVEIDFLNSMYITQGATTLPVIVDDVVSFPSITQRDYVTSENGVVVATRVPTNLFDYDTGNSISITGDIDLKLAGDFGGRRLQTRIEDSNESNIESAYGFEVTLRNDRLNDAEDPSSNSGNAIATIRTALLGIMLILYQAM